MVRDEEAEVVGPYKVHVSGVIPEVYEENLYILFRENFYYCNFIVSNVKFNTYDRKF